MRHDVEMASTAALEVVLVPAAEGVRADENEMHRQHARGAAMPTAGLPVGETRHDAP